MLTIPLTGQAQGGRGSKSLWNMPSPQPTLPQAPLPLWLWVGQRHLFPEVKQILGYSWSLDFYQPSILVNSERPEAEHAREISARPTNPKITHTCLSQVLMILVVWEHVFLQGCLQAREVTSLQALPTQAGERGGSEQGQCWGRKGQEQSRMWKGYKRPNHTQVRSRKFASRLLCPTAQDPREPASVSPNVRHSSSTSPFPQHPHQSFEKDSVTLCSRAWVPSERAPDLRQVPVSSPGKV